MTARQLIRDAVSFVVCVAFFGEIIAALLQL